MSREAERLWAALSPRSQEMFGTPEALMANPRAVKTARELADLVDSLLADPEDGE